MASSPLFAFPRFPIPLPATNENENENEARRRGRGHWPRRFSPVLVLVLVYRESREGKSREREEREGLTLSHGLLLEEYPFLRPHRTGYPFLRPHRTGDLHAGQLGKLAARIGSALQAKEGAFHLHAVEGIAIP